MAGNVFEATHDTFQARVLERSRERVVLVDFWASWCGPCQALAPVLEELAARHADGLDVVKVDSDAEPSLAGEYGVRGLPTLLVFRHGRVVDRAVGVQPPAALDALVAAHLPRPSDKVITRGAELVAAGDHAAARTLLADAYERDPQDLRLHPLLAECLIELGEYDEASALLQKLPAAVAVDDEVLRVKARLDIARSGSEAGEGEEDADPVAADFKQAMARAAAGDYNAAVAGLLDLLPARRDWRDGAIRRALLEIFQLREGDPRLREWRAQMARRLN